MIDSKMFDAQALVNLLLGTDYEFSWRQHAEIVPAYIRQSAVPDVKPKCVVKLGGLYLRHSHGPLQHHFWDMYGDDYQTPELALLALSQAPVPHRFEVLGLRDIGLYPAKHEESE